MADPVEKSKDIHKKLESIRRTALQGTPTVDGRIAPYFKEDPRDEYYATKGEIVGDRNRYLNLGTEVPITSKDIQYIQDQKTKKEKLLYDKWKWTTFQPGSDPVRLKYFEKIDPDWFAEREEQIDSTLDMTEKLALLSLHGPQNEDDIITLYGISTGKVPVPDWKLVYPASRTASNSATITQGYFNPKKYINSQPSPISLYERSVLNPLIRGADPASVAHGRQRVAEWSRSSGIV